METQERPGRLLELVGIAALSLAAITYVAARYTGPFIATQATITRSFIVTPTELSKPMYCSVPAQATPTSPQFARVFYHYQIDGQKFLGESESKTSTSNQAQRIAEAYHSGRKTTVYVNRKNPAESHLWLARPNNEAFLVLLGVVSYILAFLCHRFEPVARFFALTEEFEELEPNLAMPESEPSFS